MSFFGNLDICPLDIQPVIQNKKNTYIRYQNMGVFFVLYLDLML